MKALTIPKLELQASLLAARLRKEIENALTIRIDNTFTWTDSTMVLQWLHSLEKQPVFVANLVAEILELTTVDEWNYVEPGSLMQERGVCQPIRFVKVLGSKVLHSCEQMTGRSNNQKS